MKKPWRCLGLVVAVVTLTVALGALVPRPLWRSAAAAAPAATHRILVLKNPIHTDIAIPIDDAVRQRFHFLVDAGIPADSPEVRYIVFGWGGRAFYLETPTWSELKAVPVMKALTVDASVMHVEVAGDIIKGPDIAGFDIGEERFAALLDFIDTSFQRDPTGPTLVPGAAYSRFDGFYEANGHFNALVGCNTWTAAALRIAGLRTGWWNPLPVSLGLSMRLYN
ncbi:TIGR02117 family protein [Mesorhizobium sp. M0051]|uniref:TIGR02117 family protein n=1 Tax=unclassified Mesorhizobium TaxID=325217 RepID=UPI0003CE7C3B|nr:TIGR02117 family protein [Mesorhizobium sp. LNHC252B00]ESY66599.1 urease-associated protein [Mesorhizobium sp. LNHC252B00]